MVGNMNMHMKVHECDKINDISNLGEIVMK